MSWSEQCRREGQYQGSCTALDAQGESVLGQDNSAVRFTTFGAVDIYKRMYPNPAYDLPHYGWMFDWMHAVAMHLWNLRTAAIIDEYQDVLRCFATIVSLNQRRTLSMEVTAISPKCVTVPAGTKSELLHRKRMLSCQCHHAEGCRGNLFSRIIIRTIGKRPNFQALC